MEHSAFTNNGHVVAKRNVDISDDVEDAEGEKQEDAIVGLRQSAGGAVCLAQASDSFGQNVDEDDGGIQFLTGSPNAMTQDIDGNNGNIATDGSSVLKTTHIVIHKQAALKPDAVSPITPVAPPTPATPSTREHGFQYQWDQTAFDPVIPVRCKSSNGDLHKAKFGSGGRGRCIRMNDQWFTPSEFEAVSGRSSSKDWKRSIHYGGRTLHCLIEDGILEPHAASCTCCACCNDESVTGPVRFFVPYKRRKRDGIPDEDLQRKFSQSKSAKLALSSTAGDKTEDATAVLVSFANGLAQPLRVAEATEASNGGGVIQIIPDGHVGTISLADQLLLTTNPATTQKASAVDSVDINKEKMWDQLDEMANNLMQQVQQLKLLIAEARQHAENSHDSVIEMLRAQFEKEKNEAVNAVRIESQMQLARTIVEERQLKEIAMQQALARARAELQEKFLGSVIVDDKSAYSVWSAVPSGSDPTPVSVMDDMIEDNGAELVHEHDSDSPVDK